MQVGFDPLGASSELRAECFGTPQQSSRPFGRRLANGDAEKLECPRDGVVPRSQFVRDSEAAPQKPGSVRHAVLVQCDGSECSMRAGDDIPIRPGLLDDPAELASRPLQVPIVERRITEVERGHRNRVGIAGLDR